MENQTKSVSEKINDLKNCVSIQCQNGNWNYSEYMRGMANGLILAYSIMTDTAPVYRDTPIGGYLEQKTAIPENITDILNKSVEKSKTMIPDNSAPLMTHDIGDNEQCNWLSNYPIHNSN